MFTGTSGLAGGEMENVTSPAGFYVNSTPQNLHMAESDFYVAIAVAFVGFFVLAFVLLYPVYRFIKREEQRSRTWTEDAIAERRRQALEKAEGAGSSGDGAGGTGEPPEVTGGAS